MSVEHTVQVSAGQPLPLGCTHDGHGANFSVFSSVAEKVEICFFEQDGSERRFALPRRTGDIWHGHFDPIRPGQRYGYRVYGPWNPEAGMLCCAEKLLLDPYARAIDGAVLWHDSLFPYDSQDPEAPAGGGDTAPNMPKSVVADWSFDWEDDRPPGTELADTIIYEVHVKGITMQHPGVPPGLRGSYAGLAHPAAVEHLTKLGVTAVELLPVHQFIHRRNLVEQGLRNYWGYDPICYFTPHSEYACDRSPGGAVNEFKRMVKALHSAGLEVILDVVFNHTCEGGADGPVLSFKGLDNKAYYRLAPGDALRYEDYTGTQNTLNTEHPQVRQMVVDSLVYWATEMHVDGFRFDLAPVLARAKGRVDFQGGIFEALRREPSLRKLKLIAEPWDFGEDGYQVGRLPAGWSEWNDRYHDDVRDFWNGRDGSASRFMLRLAGSPDIYRLAERPPQASVSFVTCHDGFTLHDLVTYESKRNEANREGGRDGREDNHSWNCGVEGETEDTEINGVRDRQKRNFIATLLLSQGVPMLLGGDELDRTQRGNNNPYCQDNELSWLDWKAPDGGMLEFVSRLVSMRKHHAAFRRRDWSFSEDGPSRTHDMAWYSPSGGEIHYSGAPDTPREPLQVHIFSGPGSRSRTGGKSATGGGTDESEKPTGAGETKAEGNIAGDGEPRVDRETTANGDTARNREAGASGRATAGGETRGEGETVRSGEATGDGESTTDGDASGGDFLILFNPRSEETVFELPPACKGGGWSVMVDTAVDLPVQEGDARAEGDIYGARDVHVEGEVHVVTETVRLVSHSLVVLSRVDPI